MLVASTGLGKTVVAIHVALRLRDADEIDNVIVIGPKAVRRTWERELLDASLPLCYLVRQILDKAGASQVQQFKQFEEILETLDTKRWLLIIDESDEWRNHDPDG
ncbi:MAG: helicase, partial [Leptolyngbyaceae cyanobacterium bins.59]|nr:helicase [Leptolyngbyaceae cyanobacterium bins.59]